MGELLAEDCLHYNQRVLILRLTHVEMVAGRAPRDLDSLIWQNVIDSAMTQTAIL
jgi:hypothetical protein